MPAASKLRATPEDVLPGEAATLRAAQASLAGERRGLRALWPFLGPAFIAAVAYVDPGNFATGAAAGSKFGYLLVWVVVSANLMAMLVQALSAKLGVASGLNLAEAVRQMFGEGGTRQVKDARNALVTGIGVIPYGRNWSTSSAMILEA